MKKVTLFIVFMSIFSASFAMTNRYSIAKYERLDNMPSIAKAQPGAEIFNSDKEFASWMMARGKAAVAGNIDYKDSSLLAAYLGKTEPGQCIEIYRIDETEKYFVLYANVVKCSEKWPHPYIYFKLPKTAKTGKIILK